MSRIRPIATVLFALCLALTSVTLAVARGQAPAVGTIVVCAGGGFQTIAVDADGNPTGPAHICPDAIAAFVAVDDTPPVVAPVAAELRVSVVGRSVPAVPAQPFLFRFARAPPLV